jgi:hypothetical protein
MTRPFTSPDVPDDTEYEAIHAAKRHLDRRWLLPAQLEVKLRCRKDVRLRGRKEKDGSYWFLLHEVDGEQCKILKSWNDVPIRIDVAEAPILLDAYRPEPAGDCCPGCRNGGQPRRDHRQHVDVHHDPLKLNHEREPAMKRPPQITRVRGGEVNVNAPGDQVHDLVENIHLIHRQEIHHHYAEAQHVHHGGPRPVEIDVDPTQVHVYTGAPTVHYHGAPQAISRGEARAAPQQASQPNRGALPSPSDRASAPQPEQQPMQLTDQRATPLGFWSTLFTPQKVRR